MREVKTSEKRGFREKVVCDKRIPRLIQLDMWVYISEQLRTEWVQM